MNNSSKKIIVTNIKYALVVLAFIFFMTYQQLRLEDWSFFNSLNDVFSTFVYYLPLGIVFFLVTLSKIKRGAFKDISPVISSLAFQYILLIIGFYLAFHFHLMLGGSL